MFSPPSERLDHVIRFELTTGCTWNACTYCNGYERITPRVKTLEEYEEHLKRVWGRIGYNSSLARNLKRVFIGGGNALAADSELLSRALRETKHYFRKYTWEEPKRISIYGRTTDIIAKGNPLRQSCFSEGDVQLDLIYWGVESGSDKVLEYVNKGYTQEDLLRAAEIMEDVFIMKSVMIMPGLGGINYYQEHATETARILGRINPTFITFMGINPAENSVYSRRMQQEEARGENRPLTNREKAEQMITIIEKMPIMENGYKVGCFDNSIDVVGHNPLTFGSVKIESWYDRLNLLNLLKDKLARLN